MPPPPPPETWDEFVEVMSHITEYSCKAPPTGSSGAKKKNMTRTWSHMVYLENTYGTHNKYWAAVYIDDQSQYKVRRAYGAIGAPPKVIEHAYSTSVGRASTFNSLVLAKRRKGYAPVEEIPQRVRDALTIGCETTDEKTTTEPKPPKKQEEKKKPTHPLEMMFGEPNYDD